MIFHNPAGAPELACEQCGCRWFDRINDTCYECGTKVSAESIAKFEEAVERFRARESALSHPLKGRNRGFGEHCSPPVERRGEAETPGSDRPALDLPSRNCLPGK